MLELTNYILYDDNNKCIFTNLKEKETNEINLICNELDLLYDDLNEINEQLFKYKQSYRINCERLLKLCDDKDKLVEMFIDYYDQYIIKSNKITTKTTKKSKSSSSTYLYAIPVENRFGILSKI